jgi:aryl-alcohol dehydrogenase-like predicted oxidoreductase/histidinol phosphatase-like enzyme
MRLSTEPDRDDERSVAVLHAAFDAGAMLLDTADAYCWDESERGHNERLIALARSTWKGDRSLITVATKGGVVRPDGRWEADGRAKHLTGSCERSCRALGVDRIALYQLHVPDPRTPLATSVRALAALKRRGLVEKIGLCNVTVGQIEDARRIVDIDAIQVEASVWHDGAFLSGVAEYCVANRLMLLAHRPLGGRRSKSRTAADPALNAVAERHGVTPFDIALAWLADLSDVIVPLPGATRVETARSAALAQQIRLGDEDRALLDERFPAGASLRKGTARPMPVAARHGAEVVLLMGLPGAGKTTFAERFTNEGYRRLNRDEAGGTLRDLIPDLERALTSAAPRIVLDNTYLSRKSRAEVVRAAAARGVAVRCTWIATGTEDAQVNAVERLVGRYGRLPDEAELAALRKQDVAAFLPMAQFRAERELEPPDLSEGFSRIDVIPFERRLDPTFTNRAVIVWCDGVLLKSKTDQRVPVDPEDVVLDHDRANILRRYHRDGWRILGLSWRPEIAGGVRSRADARSVFERMNQVLRDADAASGFSIEVDFCPHAAGPPRCWCRKPFPGLGVLLIHRHRLDRSRCVYVGDGAQDPGFARKLGFKYAEARDFFR